MSVSKPEVTARLRDVCFAPISGHRQGNTRIPHDPQRGPVVRLSDLATVVAVSQNQRTGGGVTPC